MNRRAKFDAASFILGGEIRNRTNKQTVNDIGLSTPCLSACVDNNVLKPTDVQGNLALSRIYRAVTCCIVIVC